MTSISASQTAVENDHIREDLNDEQILKVCDNNVEASIGEEDKQEKQENSSPVDLSNLFERIEIEISRSNENLTSKVVQMESVEEELQTPISCVQSSGFDECCSSTSKNDSTKEIIAIQSMALIPNKAVEHPATQIMMLEGARITNNAIKEFGKRLDSRERDIKRLNKFKDDTDKSAGRMGNTIGGIVEFMARKEIREKFGTSYNTDSATIDSITYLCEVYLLPQRLRVYEKSKELHKQTRAICLYLYKHIDLFVEHYIDDLSGKYGINCKKLKILQQYDKLFLVSDGNETLQEIEHILNDWEKQFKKINDPSIIKTALKVIILLRKIHSTNFSDSSHVDELHDCLCSNDGLGMAILVDAAADAIAKKSTATSEPINFTFCFLNNLEIDCTGKLEKTGPFVNVDMGEVKASSGMLSEARNQLIVRLNTVELAVTIIHGNVIVNKVGRCFYLGKEENIEDIYDTPNRITFIHTNLSKC